MTVKSAGFSLDDALFRDIMTERAALFAEVAALKARVAELEAADQWRPVSEPPEVAGEYLGWNGYRVEIVRYLPEYEDDETDWPWRNWYDDEVEITHWIPYLAPPQDAPAG